MALEASRSALSRLAEGRCHGHAEAAIAMEASSPAVRRYRNKNKPTITTAVNAPGSKRAVIYLRVSTEKQVKREIDPQGLSVPDQREVTSRKANDLGAIVEQEFVELAETAKVLDRPELQRLLNDEALLARIDHVIVFNLSRFARNVGDQVQVMRFLRARGVELISATEQIDDTPGGKLYANMMGSFNQYHSDNSGYGAVRGMTQKARVGGTPGRAPVGYRNVAREFDGRLVKLVEIDRERADHVCWMFEAYATGEWTIRDLTEELEARGLTALPQGDRPERALAYGSVAKMLSNRYYIGIVTFRGVEYDGRHEPLISRELYEQVQTVLGSRAGSGEKQRLHNHYLKSTVYCLGCGARLCIQRTRGRYYYFFCVGRQRKQGCQQPYLSIEAVEEAIVHRYRQVALDPDLAAEAREVLATELTKERRDSQAQVDRQEARLARLADESRKLLQAHYADAVPLALLKDEQDRIGRGTAEAERLLHQARHAHHEVETTIDQALALATDLHDAYSRGGDLVRRLLNQFFFAKVLVGRDDVKVEFSEPMQALYSFAAIQSAQGTEGQGAQYLRHCAPSLFTWPGRAHSRSSSNETILAPSA